MLKMCFSMLCLTQTLGDMVLMISSSKAKIRSGCLPNTHLGLLCLLLIYKITLHEFNEKIHNVGFNIVRAFIRVYLGKKHCFLHLGQGSRVGPTVVAGGEFQCGNFPSGVNQAGLNNREARN